MAKRKRASLKDKSPETLGLTQKKGRGMDLLFGESSDKGQAAMDQPEETNKGDTDLSGSLDTLEPSASQQPGANGDLVDELGLPVAMEAPPDDLILASAPLDSIPEGEGDLATSPFAMPTPEMMQVVPDEQNDLSGLIMEDDSAIVEEEEVSSAAEPNDLSGILTQDVPPAPVGQEDLSGLAQESDLSGLISEPAPDPALTDLSGLVTETQSAPEPMSAPESDFSDMAVDTTVAPTPPPEFFMPDPPQPATTPIDVSAPPFQPAAVPAMPAGYSATPYPAAPPMPAAGYAQPYPAPAPSPLQIRTLPDLSVFGPAMTPITQDSFKPLDELPSHESDLVVKEITLAERDDDITRQVLEYVGAERRDKLFNEIEALYTQVETELSGKDANFALDTLRQAQHLILESPREYDEVFYRVAIVKTILNRKANLSKWSYSWGLFVLLYGVLWLAGCLAGGFYIVLNRDFLLNPGMALPFQSLFCAFAGGIGGCVAILWTLYYRVSVKQDFDRQHLMFYLVKPILGFILGLVMFFLLISASSIGATGGLELGFDTGAGIALACFLGFIAGFRQDNVYDWIYVIIKTISPKASEEAHTKAPLVPPDIANEYEQQVEAKQVKVTLS